MKMILLTFCLIALCNTSKGHSIAVVAGNVGKVHYSATVSGESKNINRAIAYLCNEYLNTYYPKFNEKVFLELSNWEGEPSRLSFDKFKGDDWENAEHNRPVKLAGVRIVLNSKSKQSEQILKLLDYAVNNLSALKKASNHHYRFAEDKRSSQLTLDSIKVFEILNSSTSQDIRATLNMKVYSDFGSNRANEKRQYYLQNDKFYLIDFFTDSVFLELDNIYQIISEYYLGSIIFDTDSTGYFYNRESKLLSGKFIIRHKQASYYYRHTASDDFTKRIYFEYRPYSSGQVKKFIYLADRLTLVSGFEQIENKAIEEILSDQDD